MQNPPWLGDRANMIGGSGHAEWEAMQPARDCQLLLVDNSWVPSP